MKIKVIEEGKKVVSLSLPERLVLNGFTATIAPIFINGKIRKSKARITGKMCRKFVREFYKTRKHFGGKLDLVDIETKDGTYVKITV